VKFYELNKGQAFRFIAKHMSPSATFLSAGVDGMHGRFVSSASDWRDSAEWLYCAPLEEVVPE
jgi:hypothetical protein